MLNFLLTMKRNMTSVAFATAIARLLASAQKEEIAKNPVTITTFIAAHATLLATLLQACFHNADLMARLSAKKRGRKDFKKWEILATVSKAAIANFILTLAASGKLDALVKASKISTSKSGILLAILALLASELARVHLIMATTIR